MKSIKSKVSDVLIHRKSKLWISVDTMDTMDIHEIKNKILNSGYLFMHFMDIQMDIQKGRWMVHLNLWISKWISKKGDGYPFRFYEYPNGYPKRVFWISKKSNGYPKRVMDIQKE